MQELLYFFDRLLQRTSDIAHVAHPKFLSDSGGWRVLAS